ncbi:MAG: hypothetical protein K0R06_1271 [Clostridium sp.]|jgi:hypothetical protein|nr:hypothetical protein [Clostridium sp.]
MHKDCANIKMQFKFNNIISSKLLSREVEGNGPMKPGNQCDSCIKVPIPVDNVLQDKRDCKK